MNLNLSYPLRMDTEIPQEYVTSIVGIGAENMETTPPSSSFIRGNPVQILDFDFSNKEGNRTSTLVLKKDALDSVLKKAGDLEIVVISIAGPSRRGKSFLLGFMLRFLNAVEMDEKDWMGWDDPKKPLTGFKWRNGFDREISGMWIWSEPFIVKQEDGKECAAVVILFSLDTQGVYDESTTHREWSTIFGLSLLTSSCVVFNLLQYIQEDSIQVLDNFIQYGLLVAENFEGLKVFQKLVFLIRDWNGLSLFNYGAEGGKEFIDKILEDKPYLPEVSRNVRKNIQECFEDVECFLMPAPGETVKRWDYDGSIQGLDKKFTTNVEKFITSLLSQDKLKVKTIGGVPVRAKNLSSLLEKYTEIFNNCEGMPKPFTILHATARITNQSLVGQSKDVYKSEMQKILRLNQFVQDKALDRHHEDAWNKTEMSYKSAKKVGDSAIAAEYLAILKQEVDAKFVKYKESNRHKKEQALRRAVCGNAEEYKACVLREIMDEDFLDSEVFEKASKDKKEVFIKEFIESMDMDEDALEPHMVSLREKMDTIESSLRDKNNLLRSEGEKHNEECVQSALQNYSQELEALFSNCQYVDKIEEVSKKEIKSIKEKFSKDKNLLGNPIFQKKFMTKLFESLESAHGAALKVGECVEIFKDSLKPEFHARDLRMVTEKDILFNTHEAAASAKFNRNTPAPNHEIYHKFGEALNKKLITCKPDIHIQDYCTRMQKELMAAIEVAKGKYVKLMNEKVHGKSISEYQVNRCHEEVLKAVLVLYRLDIQKIIKNCEEEIRIFGWHISTNVFDNFLQENADLIQQEAEKLAERERICQLEEQKRREAESQREAEETNRKQNSICREQNKHRSHGSPSPSPGSMSMDQALFPCKADSDTGISAIGIELGLKYIRVGYMNARNRPSCIKLEDPVEIMPFVVGVANNHIVFGTAAENSDLPIRLCDIITQMRADTTVTLNLNGEDTLFRLEELIALVLIHVKQKCEEFIGQSITGAVISIPSWFNQELRRATKDAASLSGFVQNRIISEAAAVAVGWWYQHRSDWLKPIDSTKLIVGIASDFSFDVAGIEVDANCVYVKKLVGRMNFSFGIVTKTKTWNVMKNFNWNARHELDADVLVRDAGSNFTFSTGKADQCVFMATPGYVGLLNIDCLSKYCTGNHISVKEYSLLGAMVLTAPGPGLDLILNETPLYSMCWEDSYGNKHMICASNGGLLGGSRKVEFEDRVYIYSHKQQFAIKIYEKLEQTEMHIGNICILPPKGMYGYTDVKLTMCINKEGLLNAEAKVGREMAQVSFVTNNLRELDTSKMKIQSVIDSMGSAKALQETVHNLKGD